MVFFAAPNKIYSDGRIQYRGFVCYFCSDFIFIGQRAVSSGIVYILYIIFFQFVFGAEIFGI